jgi:hypothetical protein
MPPPLSPRPLLAPTLAGHRARIEAALLRHAGPPRGPHGARTVRIKGVMDELNCIRADAAIYVAVYGPGLGLRGRVEGRDR